MRSVEELVAAVQRGTHLKYLFFWGHRARPDGRLGKSCLSQWWPCAFSVEGVRYASAEHWMMAGKARLFGDDAILSEILGAASPALAKKLGRQVRGFDPQVWDAHAFSLVVEGNVAKFGQDAALKTFLLGTGSRVLVEASPQDRIWGIGLDARDPRAADPRRWQGENRLGFALMEARDRLRRS